MDVDELLGNIAWHSLTGAHAGFAVGRGSVRRYAAGFPPIAAFAEPTRPDFAELALISASGEPLYVDGWAGAVPDGWVLRAQKTMYRMVWAGEHPAGDEAPEALPLEKRHTPQALELAASTRPGPFGPRSLELGEYFGYFEGDRLIAMAGERMCAPPLREISGVCTHPDARGRGLARRLMMKLVRRLLLRGEQPVLHVMADNTGAYDLYCRLGFRVHSEVPARVISLA